MTNYLKRKWKILAASGGLLVVVLAFVLVSGSNNANTPANGQDPNQTPNSAEPDPVEPEETSGAEPDPVEPKEDNSDNQTPPGTTEPNPAFSVQIEGLELEMTLIDVNCLPLSELAAQAVGDKTPAEIQAAFEKYEQGLSTLPQEEAWELYDIAVTLDYMLNLKNHLSQSQPGSPIDAARTYQSLGLYKECSVFLIAKNQGSDSAFGNGCGLIIDNHVTVSDSRGEEHQPLYLGPPIACTDAEVPFIVGDSVATGVTFSLPLDTELTSLTIQNDKPDSEPIVIDLNTER